ncbi:penicillin-binding protein 1A [Thiorhodococcus minor]|uniref:Penicillin-binding protein 1A n=1 Tax=Thiorhodococcus minor TaxID=57489 RepID=A0A6M0JZT1_9GAMM|nr:PBP1A family penicillin-binding protein [Thiorhodococcus minor]NEV63016.1 PBP1A family penicillin-binding protein [Thiorhodococcus minor]
MKARTKLLQRVLRLLLLLAALSGLCAIIFVAAGLSWLARMDPTRDISLGEPLRIFSADGMLMGELGIQRRSSVEIADIPQQLIQAFLAAEDSRFFEHQGIDTRGLARAAWRYLRSGEPREGGSTISMQLARNLLLGPEKTLERKLAEMLLAVHLEQNFSKEEILNLYLNRIFFGHRAYGVAAAAEVYYGKPLAELSLAEAATLAGIPKAPSTANPVTSAHRALARRNHVLSRMSELGFIDRTDYQAAIKTPNTARLHSSTPELEAGHPTEMARRMVFDRFGDAAYQDGYRVITTIDSKLQHLAQKAVREALLAYDRRHGYRGPEGHLEQGNMNDAAAREEALSTMTQVPGLEAALVLKADTQSAGLALSDGRHATLGLGGMRWAGRYRSADRRGPTPRRVDQVLSVGDLVRLRRGPDDSWELAQKPAAEAALVALDPRNGAILALAGGYDFGTSQFNRAADGRRQTGSAFKPFIYATALTQGWTPASLVRDSRAAIPAENRAWRPSNFDHRALGPIRLRPALVKSRNLATIDLLGRVGIEETRALASRMGFARSELPAGLSLALGAGSTSPLRMAGAYAVFANGGFRVKPHLIRRIENLDGTRLFPKAHPRACSDCWLSKDLFQRPLPDTASPPAAPRILDPPVAYQMHSMLQDVIAAGTGRRARALGRADLAGKTGTTNEVRDAWFCGYQATLTAVAWMGFDTPAPLGRGETGGQSALQLWSAFMGPALSGIPEAQPSVPDGMVRVSIDPRNGTLVSGNDRTGILEWVRQEDLASLQSQTIVHGSLIDDSQSPGSLTPSIIEEVY